MSAMTSRERVLTAVARKKPDRTPADYKAEPEVNQRMMAHFGLSEYEDLLKALEIDIRRANPLQVGRLNKDLGDGVFEDYWGIRSVRLKAAHGAYDMHVRTPLWDAESVDDLAAHDWPWPDIYDYSVMKAQCAGWGEYLVMYEGADLFTRPCILRNMENVMLDLVLRPEMVHYLIEKFTAFYCEDVARAFEATAGGIDLYCEWSDFGTQRGLQISIPMFREFIAPYLKRLIDAVHSGGAKFMLHSCGAIRDLIPVFLELGVDVLDPIQVAATGMDPAALKKDFGDRLAFHGGICTQRTLPFGTPEEVREAVRDRVATLGRGGGYILASSHDISADTPTANILAMYEPSLREGRDGGRG
jgi:uroporphyrinogen decarboxylase